MAAGAIQLVVDLVCAVSPIFMFIAPATLFQPVLCPGCCTRRNRHSSDNELDGDDTPPSTSSPTGKGSHSHEKSTTQKVEMPPLPLTSQLLNCTVWLLYCILEGIIPGVIPNAFGVVFAFIFVMLYIPHYKVQLYRSQLRCQLAVTAIFSALLATLFIAALVQGGTQREALSAIIGWMGFSICLLFLGYPLAAMFRAIILRNPEVLGSLAMALLTVLCTIAWTINAYVFLNDAPIFVANIIGIAIHSLSLTVRFACYRGMDVLRDTSTNGTKNTRSSSNSTSAPFSEQGPLPDEAYAPRVAELQDRYPRIFASRIAKLLLGSEQPPKNIIGDPEVGGTHDLQGMLQYKVDDDLVPHPDVVETTGDHNAASIEKAATTEFEPSSTASGGADSSTGTTTLLVK
ncbi:unnamed protein product [Amoebophrya sp. A25]|nr:unnamed protein product [Amoebophrya sp. A25]|eukprot:GSA25T00020044001.1